MYIKSSCCTIWLSYNVICQLYLSKVGEKGEKGCITGNTACMSRVLYIPVTLTSRRHMFLRKVAWQVRMWTISAQGSQWIGGPQFLSSLLILLQCLLHIMNYVFIKKTIPTTWYRVLSSVKRNSHLCWIWYTAIYSLS